MRPRTELLESIILEAGGECARSKGKENTREAAGKFSKNV
jgi:hypothetical protein